MKIFKKVIREGILKLQSNQAMTCSLNGNPTKISGCLVQCQEIQTSVKPSLQKQPVPGNHT